MPPQPSIEERRKIQNYIQGLKRNRPGYFDGSTISFDYQGWKVKGITINGRYSWSYTKS